MKRPICGLTSGLQWMPGRAFCSRLEVTGPAPLRPSVMQDSPMKDANVKLMVGLALLATGAILMCLGIRWLFFLGLALTIISGSLSMRPHTPVGWLRRFAGWV